MRRLSYLQSPPASAFPSDLDSLVDLPSHEAMHRKRREKPSRLSYSALCELDDLRELDRLSGERR